MSTTKMIWIYSYSYGTIWCIIAIITMQLDVAFSFCPGGVLIGGLDVVRCGGVTRKLHNSKTKLVMMMPPDSLITSKTTTRVSAAAADNDGVNSSGSDSGGEEWIKPRIHNTNWFRSGAILLALAVAGAAAQQSSLLGRFLPTRQAGAAIHLLSFATWFGTVVYTTFVFGITAFKNLPRQTFGRLQARLFPKYFMLGSACILLQLVTLPIVVVPASNGVWSGLGVALAGNLLNQFYVEPRSTEIMLERYDLENSKVGGQDSDRYKELKASFGKFHGISSLANLVTLIGAIVHGLTLSSLLVAAAAIS